MLELIFQDEYGQRTIIAADEDWQELEKIAHEEVCKENLDNALTAIEQKQNFEVYYVHLLDQNGERINAAYAGKKGTSTHLVLVFDNNGVLKSLEDLSNVDAIPNFYIGEFVKSRKAGETEVYYAEKARGEKITDFDDMTLQNKGFYFIKER